MHHQTPSTPRGVGNYSRRAATPWTSRAFLDRPFPLARAITRRILAAAEPTLAAIYWPALQAKSALEDERVNAEADRSYLDPALRAGSEDGDP